MPIEFARISVATQTGASLAERSKLRREIAPGVVTEAAKRLAV
jgi:hypothetical protein